MKSIQTASYKINFGDIAYNELSTYIQNSKFSNIIIIVDSNTVDLCLPILVEKLGHKICSRVIKFNFGEMNKNIKTCCDIWNSMSSYGVDRNSLIINLGGGVVTDLGGFVSSTYKRGIKFVNIPTTLLAMVDASIGGKTGINFSEAKNQIGTIAFAEMIIIDTDYLKSLPSKEFNSGVAEMFKHGLITNKIYWEDLQKTKLNIDNDLEELICTSIQIKNSIVALDPEEKNIRKSLNFGHTLGHAIESYYLKKEKNILHGEAVALGIYLETELSPLNVERKKEIQDYLKSNFTLVDCPSIEQILPFLKNDKKNEYDNINFSLLDDIGSCSYNNDLSIEKIKAIF